jgi:Flp pilus assembly protein TadD
VRERLRSLGYVTGGTPQARAVYTEADDPKRLIALDSVLQEVLERYLSGDLAGALARSRELVGRRPSMAVSWIQLAQLEREAGNAAAAVDAMQRAVTLSPAGTEPLTLLGAYLTESGRAREAADLLAPHARAPDADPDLLSVHALALARLEQFDGALAVLSRARERDPSNTMLLVHVGTVQHTRGQRAAAREAFMEAVRLDPDLARAHTSLGVLALEDGRPDQAAGDWRAATSLDPGEHRNILSLGIALARGGRTTEARACFEFFEAHAPASRYAAELGRVRSWLNGAR